jgi:hypothetical protein
MEKGEKRGFFSVKKKKIKFLLNNKSKSHDVTKKLV